MNSFRKLAFGYSTRCNIRCRHCVAAGEVPSYATMDFTRARALIGEMACCGVRGISFTAGEPLLYVDEMSRLTGLCARHGIYTRIVTNGFWAKSPDHADRIVSGLKTAGLSQLRISFSRWHQEHVRRENIILAAASCRRFGLDYFVSFVTDFSEADDDFEQFLRDNSLKFFPEPMIYFGRAEGFSRRPVFTDYPANTCAMNPYLSPDLDMFACCDAGSRFAETGFFHLGNLNERPVGELFDAYEQNSLYQLVRTMGLSTMASYLGFKARDIVTFRKCELCEKLFNSPENLAALQKAVASGLADWRR